jgi:hypothetical protein
MKNGKPIHNAFENMMGTFHMNFFFYKWKTKWGTKKIVDDILYIKKTHQDFYPSFYQKVQGQEKHSH